VTRYAACLGRPSAPSGAMAGAQVSKTLATSVMST
jgi:hypothetical protein